MALSRTYKTRTEPKSPDVKSSAGKAVEKEPFPGEATRRMRLYIERTVLALTVLGCALLVFVIWYSDGKVLNSPIKFLQSFDGKDSQSSRNFAQNCADKRNANTVYCQERAGQTDSDWKSMNRSQGGKANIYSLHGL